MRGSLFISAMVVVAALAAVTPASAQQMVDIPGRIRDSSTIIQKYIDLLKAPHPAVRAAAFDELSRSGNPALIDLAVETALASEDRTLQALGLPGGFMQVRSIVAKLDTRKVTGDALEVVKACGDAVQYQVEKYSYETGTFQVHGQDHTGVGQVNGTTLSLTIDYGCSWADVLQPDRTLVRLVSAPYKKGSLPATATFR